MSAPRRHDHATTTDAQRPRTRSTTARSIRGRRRLAGRSSRVAPCGPRGILRHETTAVEQATGASSARRAGRARRRSASSTRCRSPSTSACERWRRRAQRAPERLRLGRPQARGSRTSRSSEAIEDGGQRRAAPRERQAMQARSSPSAVAALLALAAGARAETQIAFPQGSEQPLAALQDIDVIEHLGDRVPARPARSPTGAAARCACESLLDQGKPVLVTLGYHRCPMLCGLVLGRPGQGRARDSGSSSGKDFLARRRQHRPGRGRRAAPRRRSACSPARRWARRRRRRTGRSLAGRRRAPIARARRRGRLPLQVRRGQQAVRARRGRVRADARGRSSPATSTASTTRPRDFRMAVVEAGGGRVGTSFDKVLLSCYRYDPATRRYAPFVIGFMRIGGARWSSLALVGLLDGALAERAEAEDERRDASGRRHERADAPAALPARAGVDLRPDGRLPPLLRHHRDDDRVDRRSALLAFYFFFKYRERRREPVDADGHPQRQVRDRRHRRAAVLLPALVRAWASGTSSGTRRRPRTRWTST